MTSDTCPLKADHPGREEQGLNDVDSLTVLQH